MYFKPNKLYTFNYHGRQRIGRFIKLNTFQFYFTVTFMTLNGPRQFTESRMYSVRKANIWEQIKFWLGYGEYYE